MDVFLLLPLKLARKQCGPRMQLSLHAIETTHRPPLLSTGLAVRRLFQVFPPCVACPLVQIGALAEETWSLVHSSTLIASNLDGGQSGVFVNGTRITPVPDSGASVVIVAEIP